MSEISQIFGNADSVILNQLFNILNNGFKTQGGFYGCLKNLCISSVKILITFAVQKLFKDGINLGSVIKFMILKLFYRKRYIGKSVRDNVFITEFQKIAGEKEKVESPSIVVSGIPMYMEKDGMEYILYSFPFIHDRTVEQLDLAVEDNMKSYNTMNTVFKDTYGKIMVPLELFASNNYIKLERIISTYFDVYKDTKMVTPPLIAINGEPGLGKTYSAHYIAKLDKYGEVRHMDLTAYNMTTRPFSNIIMDIVGKASNRTVIVYFDELDKYIDLYVQYAFSSKSAGITKEQGTNLDEIVDPVYENFRSSFKKSVITAITQLGSYLSVFPMGIVFIFCANNIHTLFEGIDQTHVESAKTRFTFVDFEVCCRDEFIRYITEFNNKLTCPELKYTPEQLSAACDRVRPDLRVTYRDIQISHTQAAYDINKLVDIINNGVSNPLLKKSFESSSPYVPRSSPEPMKAVELKEKTPTETEKKSNTKREVRVCLTKEKEDYDVIVKVIRALGDYSDTDSTYFDKIKELLKGKDISRLSTKFVNDAVNFTSNISIYHVACKMLDYNVLKYLIDEGLDVNAVDMDFNGGIFSLFCSFFNYDVKDRGNKMIKCLKLLRDHGIDFTNVNILGDTPYAKLMNGVGKISSDVVFKIIKMAIRGGVHINAPLDSTLGMTFISIQAGFRDSRKYITELYSMGANINEIRNPNGNKSTVLLDIYTVLPYKSSDILDNIKTLVELGADPNIGDSSNVKPFQYALIKRQSEEEFAYLVGITDDKTLYGALGKEIELRDTDSPAMVERYRKYVPE